MTFLQNPNVFVAMRHLQRKMLNVIIVAFHPEAAAISGTKTLRALNWLRKVLSATMVNYSKDQNHVSTNASKLTTCVATYAQRKETPVSAVMLPSVISGIWTHSNIAVFHPEGEHQEKVHASTAGHQMER